MLDNKTPHELALWLEKNIGESKDGFYLFNGENDEKQFEENVSYLESDITISSEDVNEWKNKGFYIVATTIDGDYIGATKDETYKIPKSLVKKDTITLNITPLEFLKKKCTTCL